MQGREIVFTAKKQVEVLPYEVPELGPREVLIETDYTVLSAGTERSFLMDGPNVVHGFPKRLGYSGSGRIVKVGAEVTEFHVGDRVLTDHLNHRSHCVCEFQKNANGFFRIEEPEVDQLEAAFVVIGSMGVQGARKTRLQLGESGMVTGLGILGMFAVQTLALSGGLPVMAVDFDAKRREIALQLGADLTLDPSQPDFVDKVREATHGRMVNCNVEVTGSAKALVQALTVASREGRISLTGCTRVSDTPVDFYQLVHKPGVQLIGAHNFIRPAFDSREGYWTRHDDFAMMLGMMARGKMKAKPLISDVVSPERAPEIYQRLVENPAAPMGIVFDWHK